MLAAGVPKFSIKGKTLLPVVPGGMGAGLPLELPGLAEGCPEVALIPILPDARGVGMVRKKWRRLKNSAAPYRFGAGTDRLSAERGQAGIGVGLSKAVKHGEHGVEDFLQVPLPR